MHAGKKGEIVIMRRWMAAATALACVFAASSYSSGISAAPALDQDEPGSVGEAAKPEGAGGRTKILPAKAAAKAAKGISSLDEDGDGLADGLKELIDAQGADALVDVIVTFDAPGKGRAWAQGQVGNFTVTSEFDVIPGLAATMRGGQAQALSQASGVFRVEANDVMSISAQAARDNFGADDLPYHVEFDAAVDAYLDGNSLTVPIFPTSGGGRDVNVCIIDTGIHGTHEMFDAERSDGILVSRIVAFVDLIADINGTVTWPPVDDNGHGTHVAGTVGGDGWTSVDTGIAEEFRGVAPQVNFLAAKVLDGAGNGTAETVLAGIEWCRNELAASMLPGVINMSLGEAGSSDGLDAVSQAVNNVVLIDQIPVIVAAGNEGAVPFSIGSPAAAADAVTVGAFTEWAADHLYVGYSQGGSNVFFSSRGPTADGRIKPDVMGPGYTIVSAYNCQDDCYAILSGTSMAAPHVTGAVALMLERDPFLTPGDIKSILTGTAQPWSTGALPNNESGWGLVDVYAAVEAAGGDPSPVATAMPYLYEGTGRVRKNGSVDIPITLHDDQLSLAITVMIDGQTNIFGEWDPDLDVQLLDEFGNEILVLNPYYPWIGDEFMPLFGTISTCKAGNECGVAGRQETVHIGPDLTNEDDWYPDNWILRVNTFTGFPNNGKAGTFSYQVSNGYKTGDGPAPDPDPNPDPGNLTADAGGNQTKSDKKNDGFESVTLDGSGSTGNIDTYEWTLDLPGGLVVLNGVSPSFDFPVGATNVTLVVFDGNNSSDPTDVNANITVTITTKTSGGGGGGGPPNRGNKNQ
jgi:serine protease AprX